MSQHWPLGKGRYFASFVHSCLAAGLAALGLFFATVLALDAPRTEYDLTSACAFWAAGVFVFVGMQGALLVLFRPQVLATLLPTPADEAAIYGALDPLESLPYRAAPYVLGIFATLPFQRRATPASVACMFTVCMVLRLLLPVLAVVGVRLRKLFVPWGHWLLWAAAIGTVVGLCSEWPARGNPVAMSVAELCSGSFWVNVAAGLLCIPLAWPIGSWARRAMRRQLRREELLGLAYPLATERAATPRKLVVEAVGGRKRLRHVAFLAQEATGLYRPRDWGMALAVWVAAFVPMLFTIRHGSGSGAHLLVTVVPLAAVWVWGFGRLIRFERVFRLWPLGNYGLPVGHVELFAARVLVFSLAYFVTGGIAAAAVAIVAGGHAATWAVVVPVSAANLVQTWLILVAWAAWLSLPFKQQPPVRQVVALMAISAGVSMLLMATLLGSTARIACGGDRWGALLHRGIAVLIELAAHAASMRRLPALEPHWVSSLFERNYWQVEALIWGSLPLLAFLSLRMLMSKTRGRAHPKYWAKPIAWQPPLGPFAGGRRR